MNSERITLMRKKPFLTILLCNLFASLTVLFFSPMEVTAAFMSLTRVPLCAIVPVCWAI